MYRNSDTKEAVVAFRGTEQVRHEIKRMHSLTRAFLGLFRQIFLRHLREACVARSEIGKCIQAEVCSVLAH